MGASAATRIGLIVVLGALTGACASGERASGGRSGQSAVASAGSGAPLAVHPLTRIETGGDTGQATLVLHLSIGGSADADGAAAAGGGAESTARGVLHVALLAPEDERAAGPAIREWVVDLRGESGAARYDALVTRTWLVTLGGVPAPVAAWARGGDGSDAGAGPWVKVWWDGAERGAAVARVGR